MSVFSAYYTIDKELIVLKPQQTWYLTNYINYVFVAVVACIFNLSIKLVINLQNIGFRIRKYVNKNNFRDKIGEIIWIKFGHSLFTQIY